MKQIENSTRQDYLDFLKAIGLLGIIIAHVGPPDWVIMIRNFDVPLMVIISSILAHKSYNKYQYGGFRSAKKYVISRILRLVMPTWLFLAIFFLLLFVHNRHFETAQFYAFSFLLTRYGIGYVWVMLVYLYSAITVPIINKLKFSINNILLFAFIYLIYEMAYFFRLGTSNRIIETTFYYLVPYVVLTFLGYNYVNMKAKYRLVISTCSLIIFVLLFIYYWYIYGSPQNVQIAKYPPRIFYLSYGIMCSFYLLMHCEKHKYNIYSNIFVKYIATHSLWIYLWHILVLSIYDSLNLPDYWYVKLCFVCFVTLLIVYIVNRILDLIEKHRTLKILKYFRG